MDKRVFKSEQAPAAIGPYSQAIEAGGLLYISGQTPLDPKTMQIVGDSIAAQTEQVFANLLAILKSANLDFSDVVKSGVFLCDLADFAIVNEIYAKYVPQPFPARTTVQVTALPRGARVEIDMIARLR